jgi:hypothetical protein
VSERVVSESEGKEQAAKFKMTFFEISAKTNTRVTECFFELVRQMNQWREKHPEIKKYQKKKKRDFSLI